MGWIRVVWTQLLDPFAEQSAQIFILHENTVNHFQPNLIIGNDIICKFCKLVWIRFKALSITSDALES
jgi:hypothetical protein